MIFVRQQNGWDQYSTAMELIRIAVGIQLRILRNGWRRIAVAGRVANRVEIHVRRRVFRQLFDGRWPIHFG